MKITMDDLRVKDKSTCNEVIDASGFSASVRVRTGSYGTPAACRSPRHNTKLSLC